MTRKKFILKIVYSIVGLIIGVSGTVATPAFAATLQSEQQSRIGLYHWTSNTTAKPSNVDALTWGTNAAANLGTHTIRVALTASDSYGVNKGVSSLASIAAQPAYNALFTDSRFSTYLLTAYSATDLAGGWIDGYTAAEATNTHDEIAALTTYLLKTYQNKKFIILNWEGDNALSSFGGNNTAWDGYIDWINARIKGVADAREAVSSTSHVYSGLEFNAVKRLDTGAACDSTNNKCVISYVAPRVDADYYSYSAWQSLDPSTVGAASLGKRLTTDLTTAYNYVAIARPAVTHANFIVGEFGTARDITGECAAAARTQKAIESLESWGASYGIFWQTMDNSPANNELFLGYGAYKRNGALSLSGKTLRTLYNTGVATAPAASCPSINNGGVVDGKTFTATIHKGSVISLFGSGFSTSGNTVWIKQNGKFYSVKAGSAWWYESPTQINAMLPVGVVAGDKVTVYIAAANGLESNGQLINVLP